MAEKYLRHAVKVSLYLVLSYGRIQSFISDIFLKVKFSIYVCKNLPRNLNLFKEDNYNPFQKLMLTLDSSDYFHFYCFQGKNNRVPSSCCKFPAPTCGYDMDTKNPIDVVNILGCSGLHFSYEDRKKFVGGVGLAIGLFNLFALLCCIIFTFCFNSARGISAIDALKGAEPSDDPVGRGTSSSTPGSTRRPPPKSALRASKEMLTEDDDDDDLPLDAYKDLRDKSQM